MRNSQGLRKAQRCTLPLLQKGFTSVEYVVVTGVVISALFLPFPGSQGMSAVGLLLAGLRNFQMHTTFLLSLP